MRGDKTWIMSIYRVNYFVLLWKNTTQNTFFFLDLQSFPNLSLAALTELPLTNDMHAFTIPVKINMKMAILYSDTKNCQTNANIFITPTGLPIQRLKFTIMKTLFQGEWLVAPSPWVDPRYIRHNVPWLCLKFTLFIIWR